MRKFKNREGETRFVRVIITAVILIIFLIFGLTSCAGIKKITDKKTVEKEKIEVYKDTTKTVATSGRIKDDIIINVPKSDNAEVMRLFNEMMGKMNTSKSSGSNSYKSTWDKENMQWLVEFIVAETKSENLSTKSDVSTDKSFDQQIDEYIKKKVIPWWIYLLGALFLWPYIKPLVKLIFPALRI